MDREDGLLAHLDGMAASDSPAAQEVARLLQSLLQPTADWRNDVRVGLARLYNAASSAGQVEQAQFLMGCLGVLHKGEVRAKRRPPAPDRKRMRVQVVGQSGTRGRPVTLDIPIAALESREEK